MTESEPTRLSHRILSSESPGLHLHLRESLPAGRPPTACRGTVLFVHGSTLSGSMWDLRAPGYSWMDHLSRRGWACYAIDLRGYGQSDWPPGLAEPAQGAAPLVQAREAVADIRDAASFALDRTGSGSLDLIEQHLAEGTEELPSGERCVRVPNGSLSDAFECFCERPLYDAGAISQPVLVIRGADDVESTDVDASGLFRKLGARVKRYVAIGAGSHFLFAERNAWQLHREVDAFLDDDPAAAQCR